MVLLPVGGVRAGSAGTALLSSSRLLRLVGCSVNVFIKGRVAFLLMPGEQTLLLPHRAMCGSRADAPGVAFVVHAW